MTYHRQILGICLPLCKQQVAGRCLSTFSAGTSYTQKVKGWKAPLIAALTACSIGACGDVIAQTLSAKGPVLALDPLRTLSMAGFSFCFQGPFSFYWYNFLDWSLPRKTILSFISKLAANQVFLGPVMLTSLFTWTLFWKTQLDILPSKLAADLIPTVMTGWMFWIPAASINFAYVPLKFQVLYMSLCGMIWVTYVSSVSVRAPPAAKPVTAGAATLATLTAIPATRAENWRNFGPDWWWARQNDEDDGSADVSGSSADVSGNSADVDSNASVKVT